MLLVGYLLLYHVLFSVFFTFFASASPEQSVSPFKQSLHIRAGIWGDVKTGIKVRFFFSNYFPRRSPLFKLLQYLSVCSLWTAELLYWYIIKLAEKIDTIVHSCRQSGCHNNGTVHKITIIKRCMTCWNDTKAVGCASGWDNTFDIFTKARKVNIMAP